MITVSHALIYGRQISAKLRGMSLETKAYVLGSYAARLSCTAQIKLAIARSNSDFTQASGIGEAPSTSPEVK